MQAGAQGLFAGIEFIYRETGTHGKSSFGGVGQPPPASGDHVRRDRKGHDTITRGSESDGVNHPGRQGALRQPSRCREYDPLTLEIGPDGGAVAEAALEDVHGQRVFDILLDGAFQGPGAIDAVVAPAGQKASRLFT